MLRLHHNASSFSRNESHSRSTLQSVCVVGFLFLCLICVHTERLCAPHKVIRAKCLDIGGAQCLLFVWYESALNVRFGCVRSEHVSPMCMFLKRFIMFIIHFVKYSFEALWHAFGIVLCILYRSLKCL